MAQLEEPTEVGPPTFAHASNSHTSTSTQGHNEYHPLIKPIPNLQNEFRTLTKPMHENTFPLHSLSVNPAAQSTFKIVMLHQENPRSFIYPLGSLRRSLFTSLIFFK